MRGACFARKRFDVVEDVSRAIPNPVGVEGRVKTRAIFDLDELDVVFSLVDRTQKPVVQPKANTADQHDENQDGRADSGERHSARKQGDQLVVSVQRREREDGAEKTGNGHHLVRDAWRKERVVFDHGARRCVVVRDVRHEVDGDEQDDENEQTAGEEREEELSDVAVDDADHLLISSAFGCARSQQVLAHHLSYLDSSLEKKFTQRSMALRVLLADESTTIKKVMQLALQDFAVEVKSVHAGIDVVDVARTFQPDIIFADVLLQKKNGYEVATSIKNDRTLRDIPVVLMWSSFMDLDEASANSCGADARLEKPFDVETLRKQVLDLVPKTRSQRLSHFLEFSPRLNEELIEDPSTRAPAVTPQAPPAPMRTPPPPPPPVAQSQAPAQPPPPPAKPPGPPSTSGLGERLAARAAQAAQAQAPTPAVRKGPPSPEAFLSRATSTTIQPLAPEPNDAQDLAAAAPAKSSWSMESFDDPSQFENSEELAGAEDDFAPLELSQLSKEPDAPPQLEAQDTDDEDEAWARQDLSQFKLDLPPISVGEGRDGFNIDMGEEEFTASGLETEPIEESIMPPPQRRPSTSPRVSQQAPQLSTEDESLFGNDLTLEADQINEAHDEVALPLEPIEELEITSTASIPRGAPLGTATPPQGLGQMSAAQLEVLIRSQSREIIEQVVRKIVPDLAATIIREELERLLEDTAVRENRQL